jgi:hypothetical protein
MKKAAYGLNRKVLKSRLRVKATGPTSPITECFDNTSGTITTATVNSCTAMSGVWDPSNSSCTVSHFVSKNGDVMTGNLQTPTLTNTGSIQTNSINSTTAVLTAKISASTSVSSPQLCSGANCKAIGDLALANQECVNGYVSNGVNVDGTIRCKALQCPVNQFFAGLDNSGTPACRPYPTNTCPTNQYVSELKPDGTVKCLPVPANTVATCPTGQILQSISAGVPNCISRTLAQSCPPGQFVNQIRSNGVVNCASPDISRAEIRCPRGRMMIGIDSLNNPICTSETLYSCYCGGESKRYTLSIRNISSICHDQDGADPRWACTPM